MFSCIHSFAKKKGGEGNKVCSHCGVLWHENISTLPPPVSIVCMYSSMWSQYMFSDSKKNQVSCWSAVVRFFFRPAALVKNIWSNPLDLKEINKFLSQSSVKNNGMKKVTFLWLTLTREGTGYYFLRINDFQRQVEILSLNFCSKKILTRSPPKI